MKWFHAVHGLGVIRADDGSGDYFVARNAILMLGRATLQEGERVAFAPVVEGLVMWAFDVVR
ncbi:cold-shock protein [Pseudomonas sp. NPDC089407]|uniref:cold-shock protein n=1 Tax=Pseudomonas sp. NPDC089407 TaxID=3364464 RepID=UPI00384B5CC6